jgi:glutamyl-tRNA synthetase
MSIKVRFPPSPTGLCHVGTARMAIVNYLFARRHNGQIVFRSEDTDRERSTREFEADIIEQLQWLGLSWDEFYRQTERTNIYRAKLHELIRGNRAYVSEEESKKEAGTTVRVIRLRNPGRVITFNDVLRGDITFDTAELGDLVIARSESDPLYHFAVVVDDAEMGITHVIRGEDHISNTPRQILIQEALGYSRPVYAHYPLHLATDRSKLSKRKGDVAVRSYREKGYLPEALLNYLACLGWSAPSEKEILSLPEMIQTFALDDLHTSGAVFDVEKLRWYNREYLLKMPHDMFATHALSHLEALMRPRVPWNVDRARAILPLIRERIHVLSDLDELVETGEFDYFFMPPTIESARIPDRKSTPEDAAVHLKHVRSIIETMPDTIDAKALKAALWDYATEKGRGAVLWPLRYALSGRERSPDPFVLAAVLGKEETLSRVTTALSLE